MVAGSTPARSPPAAAAHHSPTSSTYSYSRPLHSTHPLTGKHLQDVRARIEHDLALADIDRIEGSDPTMAADNCILLTFLTTRNGCATDALHHCKEAAHDTPFDPRTLAYHVCCFGKQDDESVQWSVA